MLAIIYKDEHNKKCIVIKHKACFEGIHRIMNIIKILWGNIQKKTSSRRVISSMYSLDYNISMNMWMKWMRHLNNVFCDLIFNPYGAGSIFDYATTSGMNPHTEDLKTKRFVVEYLDDISYGKMDTIELKIIQNSLKTKFKDRYITENNSVSFDGIADISKFYKRIEKSAKR